MKLPQWLQNANTKPLVFYLLTGFACIMSFLEEKNYQVPALNDCGFHIGTGKQEGLFEGG